MKNKKADKLLIGYLMVCVWVIVFGTIELSAIPDNEWAGGIWTVVDFNWFVFALITAIVYVIGEMMILRYKTFIIGEDIRSFGDFMFSNICLALFSGIVGFMSFLNWHLIKNLKRGIRVIFEGISGFVHLTISMIIAYWWVLVTVAVISVMVYGKWRLYKKYFKGKR